MSTISRTVWWMKTQQKRKDDKFHTRNEKWYILAACCFASFSVLHYILFLNGSIALYVIEMVDVEIKRFKPAICRNKNIILCKLNYDISNIKHEAWLIFFFFLSTHEIQNLVLHFWVFLHIFRSIVKCIHIKHKCSFTVLTLEFAFSTFNAIFYHLERVKCFLIHCHSRGILDDTFWCFICVFPLQWQHFSQSFEGCSIQNTFSLS